MTTRFIAAFYVVVFFALISRAQEHLVHTPWQLEGANERIENIRKGKVQLAFVLDGKPLKDKASIDLELVRHEFSFGVSMTQASSLSKKAQTQYRNRVKELFNFVTLGFYWAARDEKKDLTGYNRMMRRKVEWAVANDIKIIHGIPNIGEVWDIAFNSLGILARLICRASEIINVNPR